MKRTFAALVRSSPPMTSSGITGLLVFLFILLLQCAMYAGYREIFGKPDTAPADKVSLEK